MGWPIGYVHVTCLAFLRTSRYWRALYSRRRVSESTAERLMQTSRCTVFPCSRRTATYVSQPAPTIVRRHASTSGPKVIPLERTRSEGLSAAPATSTSTRHEARAGASPQDYGGAQRTLALLSGNDALQPHERRCVLADATPELRAGARSLPCYRRDEREPQRSEPRDPRAAGKTICLPFPTTPCRAHRPT